ncbi:MAG TPA: hypothetical protein VF746_26165 [Longimicrobium sp.]
MILRSPLPSGATAYTSRSYSETAISWLLVKAISPPSGLHAGAATEYIVSASFQTSRPPLPSGCTSRSSRPSAPT